MYVSHNQFLLLSRSRRAAVRIVCTVVPFCVTSGLGIYDDDDDIGLLGTWLLALFLVCLVVLAVACTHCAVHHHERIKRQAGWIDLDKLSDILPRRRKVRMQRHIAIRSASCLFCCPVSRRTLFIACSIRFQLSSHRERDISASGE